jgi:hypothetical protein
MAEKRIMQETFDLAVEENMEEFLMSKEEAIADAIKIFKCQGVNLSNIDTTGGIDRNELDKAIEIFMDQSSSYTTINNSLINLKDLCGDTNKFQDRNINIIREKGVIYRFISILNQEDVPQNIAISITDILCLLSKLNGGSYLLYYLS